MGLESTLRTEPSAQMPTIFTLGHLFLNLHHGTQWVNRGPGKESGGGSGGEHGSAP